MPRSRARFRPPWPRRRRGRRVGMPRMRCSRSAHGEIEGVDDPVLPGLRNAGRPAGACDRVRGAGVGGQLGAATPPADAWQAHHLRERHAADRDLLVADADPLLRVRLPVRDLRRRKRLPVPLGPGLPGARGGRPVGDGGVHRHPRGRPALCLPEGCPEMGLIDAVELPQPIKFVFNWGRKYSLWVFNFGLACCAIEFIATSMARHDFIRLGVIPFAHGPRQADLLVVSGTLTDKMAPAIKRLYDEMPEPKYVISFGSCSNCGGPYWDSYSVTKGVDQIIPVDVYVPGCPPRPEALLHGIMKLQERIGDESLKRRYAPGENPITVGAA